MGAVLNKGYSAVLGFLSGSRLLDLASAISRKGESSDEQPSTCRVLY